jgi:hypothetical protein
MREVKKGATLKRMLAANELNHFRTQSHSPDTMTEPLRLPGHARKSIRLLFLSSSTSHPLEQVT